MRTLRAFGARRWAVVAISLCLLAPELRGAQAPSTFAWRTLIVGGGPDRAHNQAAIESNVRYVGRLLPPRAPYHVLFADGDPLSEDVQFRADNRRLLYRAPDLPRLDGPADSATVRAEIGAIAGDVRAEPATPVLLYFTGHGSPNPRSRFNDNSFDLWFGQRVSVRDLASSLKGFPPSSTIALVMVQCFSGAFGNVLFEDGDPDGPLVDQHLAGFFAAEPQRVAAGCTAEINEAEYKDFTGYFFAALSGVDRLGRAVTGADYDQDGRVGMNEAFDYALLHDNSIDTPVCTSDTFLRRFVDLPDARIGDLSFAAVRGWAGVAQVAALDGLSDQLHFDTDDRLMLALQAYRQVSPLSISPQDARLIRFVDLARSVVLAHALGETGDARLKLRYADLLQAERANPLLH